MFFTSNDSGFDSEKMVKIVNFDEKCSRTLHIQLLCVVPTPFACFFGDFFGYNYTSLI